MLSMFVVHQCGIDSYHPKEFFHALQEGFDCWSLLYAVTPQKMNWNGRLEEATAGTCILYPTSYPRFLYCANGADFFVNSWVHFSTTDYHALIGMLDRCSIPIAKPFKLLDATSFLETLQTIVYEHSSVHPNYTEMVPAMMQVMLVQIGRNIVPYDQSLSGNDMRQRKAFEMLRKNIYSTPEKKWTNEEMAELVHFGVNQFITIYKRFFNTTPKQDLLEARIVKAKALLTYPNIPIKEISISCGFANEYYFSRTFKQKTGSTPTEYCQQQQCKENTLSGPY